MGSYAEFISAASQWYPLVHHQHIYRYVITMVQHGIKWKALPGEFKMMYFIFFKNMGF